MLLSEHLFSCLFTLLTKIQRIYIFNFVLFRILETDFYNPESSSSTISHTSSSEAADKSGVAAPNKLEQRSSHAYLRGPGGPAPDKLRGQRYHDDYRTRPRQQYRNQQFNQDS